MSLPAKLARMLEEAAKPPAHKGGLPEAPAPERRKPAWNEVPEPEFKRRREAPARRRRRRLAQRLLSAAGRAAALAPIGVLGGWLLLGALFALRSFEVSGNRRVSARWVEHELAAQRGRNLLLVSLRQLEHRLLVHTWLAGVELRKVLPDRVAIAVTEHQPVAALEVGSTWFGVTAEGVLVGRIEAEEAASLLPLHTHGLRVPLVATAHNAPLQAAVRGALEVVAELEAGRPELLAGLSSIGLLSPDDFELGLRDHPYLVRVERGHVLERWRLFERLLPQLLARYQSLEVVDLRYQKRIVLTPGAKAAPPGPASSPGAADGAAAAAGSQNVDLVDMKETRHA